MKTIYTVAVPIKDQEQANRLKQVCLDYGLPIWQDECAFKFDKFQENNNLFCYDKGDCEFYIFTPFTEYVDEFHNRTQVTEQEFIKLLQYETKS